MASSGRLRRFYCWQLTMERRMSALYGRQPGMDRTPTLNQKFLAEMLGTAFLVWVGPGSITTTNFIAGGKVPFTMADLGMIALAFAFAIAAMVYTIGHI